MINLAVTRTVGVITFAGTPISVGTGLFEGDDGIFQLTGRSDLLANNRFQSDVIARWKKNCQSLGFYCKYLMLGVPSELGFCSLYYEPVSGTIMFDPKKLLIGTGWTDRSRNNGKDLPALLHARYMSYAAMCPHAPITWAMGIKAR